MYFTYSTHKTLQKAQDALEHYFASDQVCEAERPYIDGPCRIQVTNNGVTSWANRYHVMFPG